MPQPPHSYSQQSKFVSLDLSQLSADQVSHEQKRQEAFEFSKKLKSALVLAQDAVWNASSNEQEAMDAVENMMKDPIMSTSIGGSNRTPREANLSMRMEDYLRLSSFRYFLKTASLLPPPPQDTATDEEYLAGACMGLTQDLQRYGLGRATVRDTESVKAASKLVSDVLDFLLQFDFRNGPLRRKYDGTKWCLRALETLLYELAISSPKEQVKEATTAEEEPKQEAKRTKTESPLLPTDALIEIRKRMEHRDGLRENLIKMCRDGQKAAKQSIFALHRGDKKKALQLIAKCESLIQEQLFPIVGEEPTLRSGSFANVLEEYAEAKLFATWLGVTSDGDTDASTIGDLEPTGTIMSISDFAIPLTADEYVGGICDLTGEVGRFAVQRGTVRDTEGVQLCLQTNQAVLSSLQMMAQWPSSTGKKIQEVRRSVEKIERMLYEMSLSEAAGGRDMKTDVNITDASDMNVDQE